VDNRPPKRKVARRFGHGLWATIISVATLVMGFLTIDFYNQYRDQENPVVQLANNGNTSSANAYLAGAIVCLLLTIFAAYMAVQHWRETGRS
jgi:4-hydroxybenzoate polyprenyltransferase